MKINSTSIKFFNQIAYDSEIINEVLKDDVYEFKIWKPSRNPKFIIDVGSHIGTFSLMAANMYPKAQILSFELLRENYEISLMNLQPFSNIKVFNKAVIGEQIPEGVWKSDRTYNSKPVFKDANPAECLGPRVDYSGSFKKQKLDCINFEEVFRDFNIDYIDYLKIDCEGGEYEIFPFLSKSKLIDKVLNLAVELHGSTNEKEEMITFLKNNFSKCKQKRNVFLCSKI